MNFHSRQNMSHFFKCIILKLYKLKFNVSLLMILFSNCNSFFEAYTLSFILFSGVFSSFKIPSVFQLSSVQLTPPLVARILYSVILLSVHFLKYVAFFQSYNFILFEFMYFVFSFVKASIYFYSLRYVVVFFTYKIQSSSILL